jgi:hypothetical protein
MRTFTADELKDILERHSKWLADEKGGERANLSYSNLSYSDLSYSDLSYSDLSYSDLRGSNLSYSNLRGSNLSYSDLSYSDLRGAKGISPERTTPLLILAEQVGKIRAFKLVNAEYQSPIQTSGKLTYNVGDTLTAKANTDPLVQCAEGISLCTLDWCLKSWRDGYHVMVCEFSAKDLACIPTATDGKFRVHQCKVIREYDLTPMFEREKKEREEWEKEKAQ